MKQRFKPYNKRKPYKMKKGGAKYSLRTAGIEPGHSMSSDLKFSSTIADFINSVFSLKRIRSNIKQENKENTKEN